MSRSQCSSPGTNGVTQDVQVEAYGQNVTRLRDLRIDSDTRFTAERPYVIFDSLVVEKGAKLTIDPEDQKSDRLAFQTREKRTIVLCEPGWVLDSEFFVISSGKNSAGLLLLPVKP